MRLTIGGKRCRCSPNKASGGERRERSRTLDSIATLNCRDLRRPLHVDSRHRLDVSIAQTAVIHPLHNHAHNAFERKARCSPANARLTGDATPPRAAWRTRRAWSEPLKPRCSGIEAEKHPAGEFVVVGRQSNMLNCDVDVAEASIDTAAFVDGAAARCGVNEVDRAHGGFSREGASEPDRGSLRERRRLASCDFGPLLFNGLDQKRASGAHHRFRAGDVGLGRGPLAQQRSRPHRGLPAGKFDKGVNGRARDAEADR